MSSPERREGRLTGFWYGEVKLTKTGVRFRRRFETKKAAEAYEAYVKVAGEEPETVKDAKLASPTFKELATQMAAKKNLSRDATGRGRLDWIVDRIGHMPIASITTKTLDGLVEDLSKRPAGDGKLMSNSTINRYLSAVSAVFTYSRHRIEGGLSKPEIPWRSEKGSRIHWFSEEQEDTVVAYMQSQGWMAEALAVRVLCATGMRWGEFAGLEPHQCTPEWIRLDHTKTDTPRDVPLHPELAQELKAMVVSGDVPKYKKMRTRLASAVRTCGYSDKLGIHNCRHSTATRLIQAGVPLPDVQAFLGHRRVNTTMKYVHVESSALLEASKKLSPRRGKTVENGGSSAVLTFVKSVA